MRSEVFAVALVAVAVLAVWPSSSPASPPIVGSTYDCANSTYRVQDPEIIANGGFESDLTDWSLSANPVGISMTIAHAGAKSAHVDAVDGAATFAYQRLAADPPVAIFSHWFYVEAWGPGIAFASGVMDVSDFAGNNDHVSVVFWSAPNATLRWDSWVPRTHVGGVSQSIPWTQASGAWHLFEMLFDRVRGVQCLFIDAAFVATASVAPANAFPSMWAIFGDVSFAGDAGIADYDDVSLRPLQRLLPDLAVSAADVSVSPAPPLSAGSAAAVNAVVRNVGEAAARDFNATIFVDLNGDRVPQAGEVLRTTFVADLDAGGAAPASTPWTPSVAGTFSVCAIADPDGTVEESDESNNVACLAVEVRPAATTCPLTQGYWKNHPAAWPVDSLVLGGGTYAKAELLALLRTPPRGDASVILAHQLIAAKLNVLAGADPAPIQSALADADALLAAGGPFPQGVPASTALGQRMVAVANTLDAFNNGQMSLGC